MITTDNGNRTLSYAEFEKQVLDLIPEESREKVLETNESILLFYGYLRETGYVIHSVKEGKTPEGKHPFLFLNVNLGYDAEFGSLVPQDCPTEIMVVDLHDGLCWANQTFYTLNAYVNKYVKGGK